MLGENSLSVTGLCAERGRRPVIEGLQFETASGQLTQILGPNGSGKTTLLRIIAGLVEPDAGQVLWNNKSIHGAGRDVFIESSVYIGHKIGVSADASARENLDFFRQMNAARANGTSHSALTSMGFSAPHEALIGKVSAGQRQRAALAKLLVVNAAVWILDEPFNALDKDGKALVEKCLLKHCEMGGLAIVATHQTLDIDSERIVNLQLAA
ncbi:MAG: cytochrome c biogenesis heme-transporting ATPase CcmA [Gammaproteobacteria bacterium]